MNHSVASSWVFFRTKIPSSCEVLKIEHVLAENFSEILDARFQEKRKKKKLYFDSILMIT